MLANFHAQFFVVILFGSGRKVWCEWRAKTTYLNTVNFVWSKQAVITGPSFSVSISQLFNAFKYRSHNNFDYYWNKENDKRNVGTIVKKNCQMSCCEVLSNSTTTVLSNLISQTDFILSCSFYSMEFFFFSHYICVGWREKKNSISFHYAQNISPTE